MDKRRQIQAGKNGKRPFCGKGDKQTIFNYCEVLAYCIHHRAVRHNPICESQEYSKLSFSIKKQYLF